MVKRAFALGLILLAVFIVSSFLLVICDMNKNIPSKEWQNIGIRYCLGTGSILQILRDFVNFVQNFFS